MQIFLARVQTRESESGTPEMVYLASEVLKRFVPTLRAIQKVERLREAYGGSHHTLADQLFDELFGEEKTQPIPEARPPTGTQGTESPDTESTESSSLESSK